MKRVLTIFAVLVAASCAVAPAGWAAQNPQAVLSWNSCPTQVANAAYGAVSYNLFILVKNLNAVDTNFGDDLNIFIGPNLPDAWRFDDPGCQTSSQIGIDNVAFSKTCPSLKGGNPLPLTQPSFDSVNKGGRLNLRLGITYDTFTPAGPATNYTMWRVVFNHSFTSHAASGVAIDSCYGGGQPLCIAMSGPGDTGTPSLILGADGIGYPLQFALPTDQYVTWEGGNACPNSTPTQSTTWGKMKGLYR